MDEDKITQIDKLFGSKSMFYGKIIMGLAMAAIVATIVYLWGQIGSSILVFFLFVLEAALSNKIAIVLLSVSILIFFFFKQRKDLRWYVAARRDQEEEIVKLKNVILDQNKLTGLLKWEGLEDATELFTFAKNHSKSEFHPSVIWQRDDIHDLRVMGNGCSKWTAEINEKDRKNKTSKILRNGGMLKFLASCPVYLNEIAQDEHTISSIWIPEVEREIADYPEEYWDTRKKKNTTRKVLNQKWLIDKSYRNRKSLNKLIELKNASEDYAGDIQIRVYKNIATLRIVIINENECILGHYKGAGTADSKKSPLLIFKNEDKTEWGFGGGFQRVFDEQWKHSEKYLEADPFEPHNKNNGENK